MALKRNVGILTGARYRGGGPMWAWILHRISGLGIIIFVSLHVLASFFQHQLGSEIGLTINIIYESVYFQLFIYFVVIYEYQREAIWLQWLIFVPIYGLTVMIMIQRFISGS
jgi:hypothetical protein